MNSLTSISIFNSQITNNRAYSANNLALKDITQATFESVTFQNNTAVLESGGGIYADQVQVLSIINSVFLQNIASSQSGGAIFLSSFHTVALLQINASNFLNNTAYSDRGGAIFVSNANIVIIPSTISSIIAYNSAAIGGGIFYEKVFPDITSTLQDQNPIVYQNAASVFGKNFGSFLRQISFNKSSLLSNNTNTNKQNELLSLSESSQESNTFSLTNVASGSYLSLAGFVLNDEEGNPANISPNAISLRYLNDDNSIDQQGSQSGTAPTLVTFSTYVLDMISSLVLYLESSTIQIGSASVSKFSSQSQSFSFNTTLSLSPLSAGEFTISSSAMPQLLSPSGDIFLPLQALSVKFQVAFRECQLGEVQETYYNNILCYQCGQGTFSLSTDDKQCKTCPISALSCSGKDIQVQNGYWRESSNSSEIFECENAPLNCQPQLTTSKNSCIAGYIGPLCESCDIMGTTWGKNYASSKMYSCSECEKSRAFNIFGNIALFLTTLGYIYFSFSRFLQLIQNQLLGHYLNKSGLLYISNSSNYFLSFHKMITIIAFLSFIILIILIIYLVYMGDTSRFSQMLISHLQILSIASTFSVHQPSSFKWVSDLGGDSVSLAQRNIECFKIFRDFVETSSFPFWFAKTLSTLCTPLLIVGIVSFVQLRTYFYIRRDMNLMKWVIFMIYSYIFFFPSILTLLAKSFRCRSIGSNNYLATDITVPCNDYNLHQKFLYFFNLPMLIIWVVIIPALLFVNLVKTRNKSSTFLFSQRYYIFVNGFKDKYYYWTFVQLVLKALVMFLSLIFNEYLILKAVVIVILLTCYLYILMMMQPHQGQLLNKLESQSIFINIVTLNICIIYSLSDEKQRVAEESAIFIINLLFLAKLMLLILLKSISPRQCDRSTFESFLYNLQQKYPFLFTSIPITAKPKMRTLLKMKNLIKVISIVGKEQAAAAVEVDQNDNAFIQQSVVKQSNVPSQVLQGQQNRLKNSSIQSWNKSLVKSSAVNYPPEELNPHKSFEKVQQQQSSLENTQIEVQSLSNQLAINFKTIFSDTHERMESSEFQFPSEKLINLSQQNLYKKQLKSRIPQKQNMKQLKESIFLQMKQGSQRSIPPEDNSIEYQK